jgi:hypothetical protein
MHEVVNRLLDIEDDLVVTVTTPLDRRRPFNEGDRIRLRNLLAEARTEVLDLQPTPAARHVLDRLTTAAAELDLGAGAHGAVVVATPQLAEAHVLPFPVRAAVAVGRTPATRYLLQGLRRSPRYRVLVISDRATRLFEAVRDQLLEVTGHGFPMRAAIVPRDRRAVAGRFALAPGRDDRELWRNFYRDVDRALTAASRDDPLPVVLAGVRASTALFEAVSRNAHRVVGRIDGAQEHVNARDLGAAAWPIMRKRLRAQRRLAGEQLRAALVAREAVTGIDEAWQLAREGRGRRVVVEEDYRAEPMVEVDGRLVRPGAGDACVMEDPVDELVEHVVKAGGEVEFLAPGALSDLGHIGLVLR